jgi:hypothetical protein
LKADAENIWTYEEGRNKVGHVARIQEVRNTYNILVGKSEGKCHFE